MNARQRANCLASLITILLALPTLAALQFRSPVRLTNGELALSASLPSNVNYRVDVATNLSGLTNSTAWSAFLTLPPGPATLQHTDTAAPYLPARYYRAQELAGTNAFTGDHVATTNGDVIIHPVNHASLVLKWQNVIIYNDPVGAASLYATFPRANLILVSHSHSDHYDNTTLAAVRTNSTVILAPQAVYNSMTATLKGLTTVLANGSSTDVFGINIQAIPAYNPPGGGTIYHAQGAGNGYVVTMGGSRFLFSGDTGDIPALRALTNIDVAFLCMNLPFTMSTTNAASVIRAFQPRVIYPYHYRNNDNSIPDFADFKRRVGQDQHVEVRLRQWY